MICRKYRVCRSGCDLQKSFRSYNEQVRSPRMARYRRWRYAQSANFAKAKAASARMSATGGRSSAAKGKKKRPSNDGCGTRVFAYGEDTHALCLASELADLRAGYANPSFARRAKHWARDEVPQPKERKNDHKGRFFLLAAELGFEPRHTESESAVLPLHNSARY